MNNSMVSYVIKRILLMILTLFIILTMCFVLIKLLPDPVTVPEGSSTYKHIMAYRQAHGYDKPIIIQFGIFLKSVFTKWDWGIGMNMYVDKSVTKIFAQKIPFTLMVNLYAEI